ncbi:RIP metalloprotease RseP [Fodinibius halophilus]|uniref:Zinc metalloprotease n=1 Tax=Fodinibius halophilus TaxID=1736908 RepID=A0A6M1T4R9_9BACT|nr:RIP metalloprotease RseP [Fodinibius halophilus]NGP86961.1 RIP metalloprotease RseP [Fodinibius halophilus]
MEWILSLLSTLGIFAAALLILVFFHELGHFLAAKLFGMRVERFSLGFPPRIFGFKKGETDYCIGATPLGGYVKISGMIDETMDDDYLDEEPKPWEYRSKPVWQRIIVITAGVIFNMILAVLIFGGLAFSTGEEKVELDSVDSIYVAQNSLAAQVGFQTGDKLIGVNGEEVPYFSDLFTPNKMMASSLNYTVKRGNETVTVAVPDSLLNDIGKRGFIGLPNALPSKIRSVLDGSPADKVGLKEGDFITAVNGDKITHWLQLVEKISTSEDSLNLMVKRSSGETTSVTVMPNENNKLGIYAPTKEAFHVERFSYGPLQALNVGITKTNETVSGIFGGFSKMFSGDISVRDNLGGPVAIANVTKQATDAGGAVGFWNITAFLSVTLAIMNILPIPVLDGGHLMFLIYEGITRREPSPKVRMALQQIGFLLIIALFIFVTFNDILRQFG